MLPGKYLFRRFFYFITVLSVRTTGDLQADNFVLWQEKADLFSAYSVSGGLQRGADEGFAGMPFAAQLVPKLRCLRQGISFLWKQNAYDILRKKQKETGAERKC